MTFEDTDRSISSPESADGPLRSGSPDGPTTGRSGQGHALVSRFRALDSEKAMPTDDISGPLFSVSSPSAALQWCLENRLRLNLDVNGSPEYELTWKHWDMPAGPQICRLLASARRTSGNDSGGWPTPTDNDHTDKKYTRDQGDPERERMSNRGLLEGWPTPNVPNGGRSLASAELRGATYYYPNGKKGQLGLEHAARLVTGWPTPDAISKEGGIQRSADNALKRQQTKDVQFMLEDAAHLAGWGTPKAVDGVHAGTSDARAVEHNSRLQDQVHGWVTPSARDWKDTPGMDLERVNPDGSTRERRDHLPRQAHGTEHPASTGSRGALNPTFVCWLMGYPPAWDGCEAGDLWGDAEWIVCADGKARRVNPAGPQDTRPDRASQGFRERHCAAGRRGVHPVGHGSDGRGCQWIRGNEARALADCSPGWKSTGDGRRGRSWAGSPSAC